MPQCLSVVMTAFPDIKHGWGADHRATWPLSWMMAAPALTSLVEVCHKRCLKLGMGQLRVIASHQVGKQKPGSNQRLRRATLPETPWPAVMPLCPDLPPSLACKHDGRLPGPGQFVRFVRRTSADSFGDGLHELLPLHSSHTSIQTYMTALSLCSYLCCRARLGFSAGAAHVHENNLRA